LTGLRILHVFDHSLPIHSGYAFRSASLLREQRRLGLRTFQLTTPKHTHAGEPVEIIDGITFERTPALPRPVASVPVLRELAIIDRVARRIATIARRERIQLLHAHSPVLNALACLRIGRMFGLPVVYEVRGFWEDAAVSHGTDVEGGLRYRATRALETYALRQSDAIATICEGLRDDMRGRGIDPKKIVVIPNGVDVDEFRYGLSPRSDLRASLGLGDSVVVGFIGSFYEYEGLDVLLSALPLVRREQPAVLAILVGGGPAEDALKSQVKRLGIEQAVRFVGRVPHERIQSYYSLIDIFVYPRHPMRLTETVTPLKPLEAMAHGGIVMASNVGGHRELVHHNETGYIFAAGDVEACARAILEALRHRADWERIRAAARRFVELERTWSRASAGYEQLYCQALSTKPTRPESWAVRDAP
jgi:PEP-CTERM/exosortase A-associated glycosyltransferase